MIPAPPLQVPAPELQLLEQPMGRQLTPLNVLMLASPESLVQQFSTEAVIVRIDEQMGWYFNRCRTCGNKITDIMSHRHCQPPGTRPIANYSYCFKATKADDTGSVLVTCFSPEANSLLPSKVTELLSYIPDPPIIRDLENTRHVFHVHLAKASRRGFPRFILDGAQDIPLPASAPRGSFAYWRRWIQCNRGKCNRNTGCHRNRVRESNPTTTFSWTSGEGKGSIWNTIHNCPKRAFRRNQWQVARPSNQETQA